MSRLVVLAACACGCLATPDHAGTMYRCDVDPTCPDGFTCIDGVCEMGSTTPGMVTILGGKFQMGCPLSVTSCIDAERPEHDVELATFSIDATEVSAGDYMTCGSCGAAVGYPTDGDPGLPIRFVAWEDARTYCASLARHLPTEAQWERAARVGEQPYPWGSDTADCQHVIGTGCSGPVPVDQQSNGDTPTGIHHMLGNVREWVDDAYDPMFYMSTLATNPDSAGPDDNDRVVRGGGFMTAASDFAVWHRDHNDRKQHVADIGFRCAK